jgi:hypothetical protein
VSGSPTSTQLASMPLRDMLVAALAGALLGLAIPLLSRSGGRPCASRS